MYYNESYCCYGYWFQCVVNFYVFLFVTLSLVCTKYYLISLSPSLLLPPSLPPLSGSVDRSYLSNLAVKIYGELSVVKPRYGAVEYSTVYYSTVQWSTVQYSAVHSVYCTLNSLWQCLLLPLSTPFICLSILYRTLHIFISHLLHSLSSYK